MILRFVYESPRGYLRRVRNHKLQSKVRCGGNTHLHIEELLEQAHFELVVSGEDHLVVLDAQDEVYPKDSVTIELLIVGPFVARWADRSEHFVFVSVC